MCPGCGVEGAISVILPEEAPEAAAISTLADSLEELPVTATGIRAIDSLIRGFPTGVTALIHGNRGAGKSTLSLQIAAGLARGLRGYALVAAPEMSRKILEFTARHVAERSRLVPVLNHLSWEEEARRVRARVVVLDSITVFPSPLETVDQAIQWARAVDGVAILLAQHNGEGRPAGGAGASYNPDAVFEVHLAPDGARWFSVDGKCRWAPLGRVRLEVS